MTEAETRRRAKPYHHGNLVDALLAVAIAIIEEKGVEQLSMREIARRAGVSAGAPFQHFASKAALLTAVAEQAMQRLTAAIVAAEAAEPSADPLTHIEAIGQGYLQWALNNPTHFVVISSRTLIDFAASDTLRAQNEAIRLRMVELLTQAKAAGHLAPASDIDHIVLASRAFVYGLARMAVDGHFPEWHVRDPAPIAVRQALHVFIKGMR